MSLGARIEERRRALGIKSQSELARRSGVAQTTLNGLIKKPYRWSPHLPRIARELQTTVDYLVGDIDDPNADAPPPPEFTPEARDLIQWFGILTPTDRTVLLQLVRSLATKTADLQLTDAI